MQLLFFLQHQFYLHRDGDDVHVMMQRPFRPTLWSKLFLSSEHKLTVFELLRRISCVAYLFAIRKEDYEKLKDIYNSLYVHWDGVITDQGDDYVVKKMIDVEVGVDLSLFPRYDQVITLNQFECGYRTYRGKTMSWHQYRDRYERDTTKVYHVSQLRTHFV